MSLGRYPSLSCRVKRILRLHSFRQISLYPLSRVSLQSLLDSCLDSRLSGCRCRVCVGAILRYLHANCQMKVRDNKVVCLIQSRRGDLIGKGNNRYIVCAVCKKLMRIFISRGEFRTIQRVYLSRWLQFRWIDTPPLQLCPLRIAHFTLWQP